MIRQAPKGWVIEQPFVERRQAVKIPAKKRYIRWWDSDSNTARLAQAEATVECGDNGLGRWIEDIDPDRRLRIAVHATEGFSGLRARQIERNLPKTNSIQKAEREITAGAYDVTEAFG